MIYRIEVITSLDCSEACFTIIRQSPARSMVAPAPTPPAPATNGDVQKKAAKSKNALRRQKAKAKKAHGESQSDREGSVATTGYATTDVETDNEGHDSLVTPSTSVDDLTIDTNDPAYAQFAEIFNKFQDTGADGENEEKVSVISPTLWQMIDVPVMKG
jgi:hypothetical protein